MVHNARVQKQFNIMSRKIGLKELHSMASSMKYYDFENWVAKELFNQPETIDTSQLTDKLFLHSVLGQSEQLLCQHTESLKAGHPICEECSKWLV